MNKLVITITGLLFPVMMSAQTVAYVYADSLLLAVPAYGKNIAKLDSTRQRYQKEIETAQNGLQQQYNKLVTPYAPKETETIAILKQRMSPSDTLSLSLLISDGKQLQNKKQVYDQIIQTAFNKDIQPLLDKINKTINNYARTNKIGMVLIMEQLKNALAYIDPKQNITDAVIEQLGGNALPVKPKKR
jgi:Skp family chaperone for outer membrane proteins